MPTRSGAASPTRALSDGFEERVNAIGDYVAAFKLQPGQVGVLYRIGGVLAGLDLFASERTFARAFAKLVRGSALQALAGYDKDRSPSLDEPGFLRAALMAPADRFPAVGLGEELRIDTDARVRHVRGRPIPGLYAAGGSAAYLDIGSGYQSGIANGRGMIWGYLAGRHAAASGSADA